MVNNFVFTDDDALLAESLSGGLKRESSCRGGKA